jgi:hypothetical protein
VVAFASPRWKAAAWVIHKGPIDGFLMTRLGPVWITPPRVAVHTIRVGNMLTLDKKSASCSQKT